MYDTCGIRANIDGVPVECSLSKFLGHREHHDVLEEIRWVAERKKETMDSMHEMCGVEADIDGVRVGCMKSKCLLHTEHYDASEEIRWDEDGNIWTVDR